ncbi:MAG: HipA domain-containing protein, partial [Cyclobacteriaceae bacterium]
MFGGGVSKAASESGASIYNASVLPASRVGLYSFIPINLKNDTSGIKRYIKVGLNIPARRSGFFTFGQDVVKLTSTFAEVELMLVPLAIPITQGLQSYIGAGGGLSVLLHQKEHWSDVPGDLKQPMLQPCIIGEAGILSKGNSSFGMRFLVSYSDYSLRELSVFAGFGFSDLARAAKMSIQGVQPKLSVKLNIGKGIFEVTDTGGTFIIKPPQDYYPELPENEDLTMRLARVMGIEVPLHGMIYAVDGNRSYFIKRFDRLARGKKAAV